MADQWKHNNVRTDRINSRKGWSRLLASLPFSLLMFGNISAVKAQVPFTCTGDIFISQGTTNLPPTAVRPVQFNDVDTRTTPFTLTPIGAQNVFEYNAIGYNVQDNLVYGVVPRDQGVANPQGTIVQIDSAGVARTIGMVNGGTNPPAGLPANSEGYIGGDMDDSGFYYLFSRGSAADPRGRIVRIRITNGLVDGASPTVTNFFPAGTNPRIGDFAFNPVDGVFYGYDRAGGQMVSFSFNPVDGSTIPLNVLANSAPPGGAAGFGQIGAAFFDAAGNFFGYQNDGALYRINVTAGASDRYTLVSTATSVAQNDGTACPYVPVFTKLVNPTQAVPGDTVTYTYQITNGSRLALANVQFSDAMLTNGQPDGRTFVPGSVTIQNATGGTIAFSNNNSQVDITGLTIAGRAGNTPTVATIQIQVQLADDISNSTFLNQAVLNGQFQNLGTAFSIESEFPITVPFPDPTPLVVTGSPPLSAANLRLVKRVTGITRNGVSLSGINFSSFVDDPDDANDNAAGWSDLSPVGILGLDANSPLQSNDEVEYTIYFLSDGGQTVTNVRVCDRIHPQTTFLTSSFGNAQGITVRQGTTVTAQTNSADSDRAQFVSPLTPTDALIPPCPSASNTNGLVFVNLGDVTNSGIDRVGFVRFKVRVN